MNAGPLIERARFSCADRLLVSTLPACQAYAQLRTASLIRLALSHRRSGPAADVQFALGK
jgi:hypothetical protein